MSLASLLNLGKDANAEPPIPAIEEAIPPIEESAPAAKEEPPPPEFKPRVTTLSSEELKLAQELAQTQSKALEPEIEKQRQEEEAARAATLKNAAAKAAALAKQAKDNPSLFKDGGMYKAMGGGSANPFSTGGTEFKRGEFVCDTAFGTSKPVGARSTMDFSSSAGSNNWQGPAAAMRGMLGAVMGGCGGGFGRDWGGDGFGASGAFAAPGSASGASYGDAWGKGKGGGFGAFAGGYDAWSGGGAWSPSPMYPTAAPRWGGEGWPCGGKGAAFGPYSGGYGKGPAPAAAYPAGYGAVPQGYGGRGGPFGAKGW